MATVSFKNDIAPPLSQYIPQMAWRLDLASYQDVKANFQIILDQIAGGGMPPPHYPFPANFIDSFKAWKDGGFAP